MGAAMTLSTPQEQVDALIHQVAEENGLEVMDQLNELSPAATASLKTKESVKEDDLTRR